MLSTSGGLGEAETAGVVLNVIPRDGGNTFSGSFVLSGANGAMQGSNYTQALKDAGLRSPAELIKVWEVNPMGGGPIVRDRLWFYLTYREVVRREHGPRHVLQQERAATRRSGSSISTPAGRRSATPRAEWPSRRLTWQVSPRNKISFMNSEQYSSGNRTGGGVGDADA